MAPSRILVIRHAEEHGAPGVMADGTADAHSLTVRGWQRAGALARFFAPVQADATMTPLSIFASKITQGSETRRPQQTVRPLAALLGLETRCDHAKGEIAALVQDVMTAEGVVLIAWEHSRIPDIVAALPGAPGDAPTEWPAQAYDLVWCLDRDGAGWRFAEREQDVLAA